MALIGTIRKNFWFVLILLGMALAAFIMMDMGGSNNPGGQVSSMTMGKVAGTKIDYRAFQQAEQSYYANSQGSAFEKRRAMWDFFVQNALLKKEGDALGLNVSTDELMDLQFGASQSPVIQRNWKNPQTGQIDNASLQQFKTAIENNDPINPQFRAYWAEQEKVIIKERIEAKLNGLVNKAVYSPTWLAEESHKMDNNTVDFDYIKIPFDNIDGAGVEVSDTDITSFISEKKHLYEELEETRIIELAEFSVIPTAADSASIIEKLSGLKTEFAKNDGDSLFAVANKGAYTHFYARADQLPEGARAGIQALTPGGIYGPFVESDNYIIVKLLDAKSIPDTVSAQHILVRATEGDASSFASASLKIDSIRNAYNKGISFDTLAVRHSDDISNKAKGGDLGKFTQEAMVPEFTTACFAKGRRGGVYKVTTQYGVHLVKVNEQIFNDSDLDYRIASIAQPIVPSQETQDAVYDRASEIVSTNRDINALTAALESVDDITLNKSGQIRINDYNVGTLTPGNSSREIVKWAFEPTTELGDVSPEIYQFRDEVRYFDNNYVIASLNSIIPAGLPTADAIRNSVEAEIMNKKKAEKFASNFTFSSLEDAASAQGVEVKTASDVGSKSGQINGIGKEPQVLAAAFGTQVQAVSKPIVGNTGVYVIKPLSNQEAGPATNFNLAKTGLNQATRSQVNFSLIKNMTKRADIEDDRSTFF